MPEKKEGEVILPTEIKAFLQCKAGLLPSLGSARAMSRNVFSFTNKLVLFILHKILSLD